MRRPTRSGARPQLSKICRQGKERRREHDPMSLLVFPAELVRAAKLSYPTAPAPAPAPSAEEW